MSSDTERLMAMVNIIAMDTVAGSASG